MKLKKIAIGAFALGAGTIGANSFAASDTATASATVIRPISITKTVDLAFGKISPVSAGSVKVDTDGARTTPSAGPVLVMAGSTVTAAKFDVTGETSTTYAITYNPTAVLTHTNTVDTMALSIVSDLSAAGGAATTVATGTLSAANPGVQSIYVGGTLTVATNQTAGSYSGSVQVTVEYN